MSVDVGIEGGGRRLRMAWPDGFQLDLDVRWLIDHAAGARDPVSGQRRHGALALSHQPTIAEAALDGSAMVFRTEPGAFTGRVDLSDLRPGDDVAEPARALWPTPESIESREPIPFEAYLEDDEVLGEALARVAGFGLVLLDGASSLPGTVERAVQRFGFIQETNYGRIFDVRIEAFPNNLAFSDRGLELHTDNPYRDPPPTLQLLHALVTDPSGGETLFVDGFAQAERFRSAAPEAFALLTRTPVRFRFADATGACWTAEAPIIALGASGEIETIRLNHRALDAPAHLQPMADWYDAYLAFYRIVHAPEAAWERTLRPGEMVIFDNRRILHGRRTLTGGSPRWLQGCYAHRDGLLATLSRLRSATRRTAAR